MQTGSKLAQVPERNCCLLQTPSIRQREQKMTGWEWQSIFSWEPLHLTSCWHRGLCYCQCAYFPKGPWAVWFSALSGLSVQDTNLSSIKIAVRLFFCLARTVRLLGERLPGYYLHSRIFSALPCDTVSKQHIIQLHPALFLKSVLLMRLLLHLSILILTSCLSTLPRCISSQFFTTVSYGERRHPKHLQHRLSGMLM